MTTDRTNNPKGEPSVHPPALKMNCADSAAAGVRILGDAVALAAQRVLDAQTDFEDLKARLRGAEALERLYTGVNSSAVQFTPVWERGPLDIQQHVELRLDTAEFMRQMSATEQQSLVMDKPVPHPNANDLWADLAQYQYQASMGLASGTMRAVPQEQWDRMCKALRAAQVQLEILALVFRSYEAQHRTEKTEESDYKAAVNQAHATSSYALAKLISEVLS